MSDIDHLLHTSTQAADLLKAHLREIMGEEDSELFRDTIEGEIDLKGIIALAAEHNVIDAATVEGTTAIIDKLVERRQRIKKRIELRRVAILAAMQAGELRTVETPAGTITRKATPPSVLIIEEAAIPAEFWKPSDPTLDKKAVADALKAKREVPGAMMSNGGETLQVRT